MSYRIADQAIPLDPLEPGLQTLPGPDKRGDWFSILFGFREPRNPEEVKKYLRVFCEGGVNYMLSLVNMKKYKIGKFVTPSLRDLRMLEPLKASRPGRISFTNEIGDVAEFHNRAENRFATFQVASQFNCLEFVDPSVTPEDGITGYETDKTQGPACSIACGPATAFRNYFHRWEDGTKPDGQSKHKMINNLDELQKALSTSGKLDEYFSVRGGYTESDDKRLQVLTTHLETMTKAGQDVSQFIKIGVHQDVEVTAARWGRELRPDSAQEVTQVFGAACAIAYSYNTSTDSWASLAKLILNASYEATFWAGLDAAVRHGGEAGSKKIYLTCLGAGVFGNPMDWVKEAIQGAMDKFKNTDLEVICVTYAGAPPKQLQELAEAWPKGAAAKN